MRFNPARFLIAAAIMISAPLPFWAAHNVIPTPDCLPSDAEIAAKITQADSQRDANLRGYSVVRKYKLHNSHLKEDAIMTVRLSYVKGQGKSFEVVDLQNAEGMSRRVLQKIIDSEAQASSQTQDPLDVTSDNYKFHVTGVEDLDGRRCYVVSLTPKLKSKYLVQGKAWIDTSDFGIVRIEGRPAASLSFWVGKPYIVQQFQKVGQFWMASHCRSESQSFLLGSSVLTIEYSGYDVNNPDIRVAENLGRRPKRSADE